MSRRIVWFSCGAASAVAAKLAIEKYGPVETAVVYCDTSADEHPDNARFFADVERWIGKHITRISSKKYASIEEVFVRERYMSGIAGAKCTVEMKRLPRLAFQTPDDIHIFGFTADEQRRITRFEEQNVELLEWILRDEGYTKDDCLRRIAEAGIEIPAMYRLGYRNNNCIGCVKAQGAKYWNQVRRDFPDVFQRRVEQSRELNVRLVKVKGERIFLGDLPADHDDGIVEDISCGPDCPTTPEGAIP